MSGRPETQCAVCHRALYAEDADAAGRCVDCRPPEAPRPTKAPKTAADADSP